MYTLSKLPLAVGADIAFRKGVLTGLLAFGSLMLFCHPKLSFGQNATLAQFTAADEATHSLPGSPRQGHDDKAELDSDQYEKPATMRGMPRRFLADEVGIVTSPARTRTDDLKWLVPLVGVTGASLGTDTYTMRNVVSRNISFNDASNKSSDVLLGSAIGVPVLLFGLGHVRGDEHLRETGLLASEAMLDAYVFDIGIKYITLRERPNQNDARGHFFVGNAVPSPSFVSGHSIIAWSSAAVLASEYNRPWQQVGIYTLASGVSLTRVLAQQHFPTDALLGSAAGWLIGHYVYRKHHRSQLTTIGPKKRGTIYLTPLQLMSNQSHQF